jgi:hypothetical protein
MKGVLIVDEDDARRRALAVAFAARNVAFLEVADAFGAMAALGRADFGAVVASEGRRHLSLRGLCQLARKRHQDINILIVQRHGSDAAAIRQVLGDGVEIVSADVPADRVASTVVKALSRPKKLRMDLPTTVEAMGVFDDDKIRTDPATLKDVKLDVVEKTQRERGGTSTESQPEPVVLEGSLEGGLGPALLVGLFAQDLAGRLVVHGGSASGTLYFYRGEPVWADDPKGDTGLYARLIQKKVLDPTTKIDPVPEGQLLGSLVQSGALTGQVMHDFMRELVRDRVLALADQDSGGYRFVEDRSFLDVAPLLKVNPFGLVFESRRRKLPPQSLLAVSREVEGKYVVPAPGLGPAAEKIRPFCNGRKIDDVVKGMSTVRAFSEAVGLDLFMGTLVIVALRDCRLVSLADEPNEQTGQVALAEKQAADGKEEITVVDAEVHDDMDSDEADGKAREQILAMYMRLKPLSAPRQIVGVGYDVDQKSLDKAYAARMREIDALKIPQGSAEALLYSRIEELRRKVSGAYQALQEQMRHAPLRDDTIPEA